MVCVPTSHSSLYLLEDVLLSHKFLAFTVWLVYHNLQHILPTVRDVHHKKHQILQQLGYEPARAPRGTQRDIRFVGSVLFLVHLLSKAIYKTKTRSHFVYQESEIRYKKSLL